MAEMLDRVNVSQGSLFVEFGSQFRGSRDGRGSFFMCFEHEEEVRQDPWAGL